MVNSIPRASNVDDNGIGRWEKSVTDVNDIDGFFCMLTDAEDVSVLTPPIKRKTNFLSKIFSPFAQEKYFPPQW